jgi:hypothetical protein
MLGRVCIGLTLAFVLGAGGEEDLPAGWRKFRPQAAEFSVLLPGKPSESKQEVKTPAGKLDVTLFIVDLKGEGVYVVGYSQFPDAAIKAGTEEKRLDNARDGAVTSVKGKLRIEKKITLGAHSGRELFIDSESRTGNVRTRVYSVKNRLYQTMVVGSKGLLTSREVILFLDSFSVTP